MAIDKTMLAVLLAAWLAGGAVAQPPAPPQQPQPHPQPQPQPVPKPEPQPQQPAPAPQPAQTPAEPQQGQPTPPADAPTVPAPPPVDAGAAAAELLRRALGLKPGPAADTVVPKGPPVPPPAPDAALPQPQPEPQPQEPVPPPPRPDVPPEREQEAAQRALERLLPKARAAEVAPVGPVQPDGAQIGPPPPPVDAVPKPIAVDAGYPVHGSVRTRYRARSGGRDDDHDLVTLLGLDLGVAERHAVTAHFLLRAFADLDGREPDQLFAGLDQSRGREFDTRAYEAYVDAHTVPHLDLARLGRQPLDETPAALAFDGLRLDTERLGPVRAWASVYGGIPVHQFESSARGDDVFGAALGLQPWHDGRVRLDWMRLDDQLLTASRRDDLIGVSMWQGLGDVGTLRSQHVWRNGQPHELALDLALRGDELGLDGRIAYRELLRRQSEEVTELDPFTAIALEQRPYRQVDVSLEQDLGAHCSLSAGVTVRRLRDPNDEGPFQREFERLHADATAREVLAKGIEVTLDGSLWNSQGEDTRSVAGSIACDCGADVEVTAGTAYDLYKYDALADRERVRVRSWFAHVDWRASATTRLDLDYTNELDETERFHTFRLGLTWTF